MSATLGDWTERFFRMEREEGLLDVEVAGVRVWERIRFHVHRALLKDAGIIREPHEARDASVAGRLREGLRLAREGAARGSLRAPRAEVLFVGHPRRKPGPDGTWWDIYCDPLLDGLGRPAVCVEPPSVAGHLRPARTPALRHLDDLVLRAALRERLSPSRLPAEDAAALWRMEDAVVARFGAGGGTAAQALAAVRRRAAELPLYERLLRRVRPKAAVVVCSYGKETLLEACRRLGVPSAELQHGTIHRYHVGYSFPQGRKDSFPDHFLSFGAYWTGSVPLPASARVHDVGFAYFEMQRREHEREPRADQVLFVSQGSIGAPLTKAAVELRRRTRRPVVVKLHPGEYARWRTDYPWLAGSGVEVVDHDRTPLYRLFARSEAQVGVNSTALYEGLGFGLRTVILDLPGAEYMQDLVRQGLVAQADGPEALARAVEEGSAPVPDVDRFFRRGAREAFASALDRIVAGG